MWDSLELVRLWVQNRTWDAVHEPCQLRRIGLDWISERSIG